MRLYRQDYQRNRFSNMSRGFRIRLTIMAVFTLVTSAVAGSFLLPPSQTYAQEEMCEVDVDVVMIMDRSGSMNLYSKMDDAKAAANNFVDNLGSNDQSAVVSFSSTVTLDKTLSNNHTATKATINGLVSTGSTNIGDAIDLAIGELSSGRVNPQANKVAILLTDGKANKPSGPGYGEWQPDVDYAEAKAAEAAANDIKIFTVGLGSNSDINETMLQNIASITNASYHHAPDGDVLDEVYEEISQQICQYGSISGCKYADADNDGDLSGEQTLAGWEIVLTGGPNSPLSQLTDENGCYTFAGLLDGGYTVSETLQTDWLQTYPEEGSWDVTIANHNNVANKDFGNYEMQCGNDILDDGEECDGDSPQSCTTQDGYAGLESCIEPGEVNQCTWDSCVSAEYCGDGLINGPEQCDGDTGVGEHQICNQSCELEDLTYCGDGVKQTPNDEGSGGPQDDGNEQCDGTDGVGEHESCTSECVLVELPFCGNSELDQDEQCDGDDPLACTTPDGYTGTQSCIEPGEVNQCAWDACVTTEYCGDNIVNGQEECDGTDSCTDECVIDVPAGPSCGDGEVNQPSEQCDDGNTEDGDGCSASCQEEIAVNSGDIVINEIMQNPSQVSDTNGEWVEFYNTTDNDLNLFNCSLADIDGNFYIINQSVVVPAGGYAVLGIEDDTGANGGANVDHQYSSFILSNGDDEVILTCDSGEIDRVEYDGGPNFPDPNGASMILSDPGLDNNVGANWCESTSSFGDGDLGTPGSQNDSCGPGAGGEEPVCGDGEVNQPSEQCDDGNSVAGDGCSASCIIEYASISGCKYLDSNANGVIDEGENKLSGWEIVLLQPDQSELTATTGEDGCYGFLELDPGEYEVSETLLSGWTQTYPENYFYSLVLNYLDNLVEIDFANYEPSSDQTYCGDGIKQTPNEMGSGGPQNDGNEECDGSDGVTAGYACTSACVLVAQGVGGVGGPVGGTGTPAEEPSEQPAVEGYATGFPSLAKSVNQSQVNPGGRLTYTITITNDTSFTLTDVVLTDSLPLGFTFVDDGAAKRTWEIGTIAAGENLVYSYEVGVGEDVGAGLYANTAKLVFNTTDQTVAAAAVGLVKNILKIAAVGSHQLIAEASINVLPVKVAGFAALPDTSTDKKDINWLFGLALMLAGLMFYLRGREHARIFRQ